MRSLGWHVDNACPLLIKGATTRLDVIAGDDTAGIPPDPRLEPRVEPASTVPSNFIRVSGNAFPFERKSNGHRSGWFEYTGRVLLPFKLARANVILIRYRDGYNRLFENYFKNEYFSKERSIVGNQLTLIDGRRFVSSGWPRGWPGR